MLVRFNIKLECIYAVFPCQPDIKAVTGDDEPPVETSAVPTKEHVCSNCFAADSCH